MSGLSTHILDTASGKPAADVAVRLYRLPENGSRELLEKTTTNQDGRTDAPLLSGEQLKAACYELEFDIGPYFAGDEGCERRPFLDTVVIRVNLKAGEKYHVPLLVSPWSYSTYRGS